MDEQKWPLPWKLGEQHESMTRIVAANGVQVCECFASFPFMRDHERLAKSIIEAMEFYDSEKDIDKLLT
jgi:hypothetical protein